MITRYGMSDEFDMVALETVTNQYLGGDASLACSADTQKEIDRQVTELVKKQHQKAKKLLLVNATNFEELSNYLYEKETDYRRRIYGNFKQRFKYCFRR